METEKARIIKAGSVVTEGRVDGNLNLSRALGDMKHKRVPGMKPEEQPITAYPEIKARVITKDCDFLILACDGIWELKSSQDVVDFVYARMKAHPGIKLSKIVEELLDDIISPDYTETQGLGCDNMTCMIVQFNK